MFIGYLSSFFIALLLSIFYLSYAASGILGQIRKEIIEEIKAEVIEEYSTVSVENSFVFDYYAEISKPNQYAGFSEFAVDIPIIDDDIPIQKICLTEYFLRPPPKEF